MSELGDLKEVMDQLMQEKLDLESRNTQLDEQLQLALQERAVPGKGMRRTGYSIVKSCLCKLL